MQAAVSARRAHGWHVHAIRARRWHGGALRGAAVVAEGAEFAAALARRSDEVVARADVAARALVLAARTTVT